MKLSKHDVHTIYTIFVFVALASLDNAVIGMFPPLFSSIARDLNIHVSQLGLVSAVTILTTSISSIFWGYLADKGGRKRLIVIGTVIWSFSVFLTSHSHTYMQVVICQFFTGIGLGCIGSIGYSVLTDFIPQKWRGMLMSLWGLSQGFGGIAGSVMASIVSTAYSWRRPFEVISILGLAFIVLYFFIKEPKKGATEPELKHLVNEGFDYNYNIEYKQIRDILTKKTNQRLILQGFFMNITTGTLIWLPTLYLAKIEMQGYSAETSIIASGFLFALLQTGGLSSIYFGYLGDRLQKRTYRGRALLAAICIFSAIPLYVTMFLLPMNHLQIPDNANPVFILAGLVKQIFSNPWMFAIFALAVGATAAQSANTPNWLALLTDVNLPEHRTTVFSIANLINGMGRSIGNVFIGVVLRQVSLYLKEPNNYILTMIMFQVFFIPAVLSYISASKRCGRDIRGIKILLKKRARNIQE